MYRRLLLPALSGAIALAPMALAVAPAGATATGTPLPTCTDGTCTVSYALTGAPDTFTVPAGVSSITATVSGGSGGSSTRQYLPQPGGPGGSVVATVPVTPGATVTVVVGGQGADATTCDCFFGDSPGGYGSGGAGERGAAGAGGGGSFLFDGPAVLVAAGGGGGGGHDGGGSGGAGGAGGAGSPGNGPVAGAGASTSAPGAGGVQDGSGYNGEAGTGPASGPATFGTGGVGGVANYAADSGGGGGGYYGGGSGALALAGTGSGGGGSGFLAPGVVATDTSTHTGDGQIDISYAEPSGVTPTAPTSCSLGAPTIRHAWRGHRGRPHTATLSWKPLRQMCPQPLIAYRVVAQELKHGRVMYTRIFAVAPTAHRHRMRLSPHRRWRFAVAAVNGKGTGPLSAFSHKVRPR